MSDYPLQFEPLNLDEHLRVVALQYRPDAIICRRVAFVEYDGDLHRINLNNATYRPDGGIGFFAPTYDGLFGVTFAIPQEPEWIREYDRGKLGRKLLQIHREATREPKEGERQSTQSFQY